MRGSLFLIPTWTVATNNIKSPFPEANPRREANKSFYILPPASKQEKVTSKLETTLNKLINEQQQQQQPTSTELKRKNVWKKKIHLACFLLFLALLEWNRTDAHVLCAFLSNPKMSHPIPQTFNRVLAHIEGWTVAIIWKLFLWQRSILRAEYGAADCYILGCSELGGRWAAALPPRSSRILGPLMGKVEEMSCY